MVQTSVTFLTSLTAASSQLTCNMTAGTLVSFKLALSFPKVYETSLKIQQLKQSFDSNKNPFLTC